MFNVSVNSYERKLTLCRAKGKLKADKLMSESAHSDLTEMQKQQSYKYFPHSFSQFDGYCVLANAK